MAQLNCPGCGTSVPAGTAICPKCDHIIDASFLGDLTAPPDEGTASGEPSAAPKRPQLRPQGAIPSTRSTGSRPAVARVSNPSLPKRPSLPGTPKSGARPAVRGPIRPPGAARPSGSNPSAQTEMEVKAAEPEADWHVPKPDVASSAAVTSNRIPRSDGYGIVPPEQALSEAKAFVSELTTADKLAFVGAAIVVLMCFFPWKETVTDGEVLGLVSAGFLSFLAALGTVGVLVIRVRRVMPRLNPLVPWLVQLGASGFCVVWCLIFIKVSWDGRHVASPIGNYEVAISRPSFGVVVALLGGLIALSGTLMGLREKPGP